MILDSRTNFPVSKRCSETGYPPIIPRVVKRIIPPSFFKKRGIGRIPMDLSGVRVRSLYWAESTIKHMLHLPTNESILAKRTALGVITTHAIKVLSGRSVGQTDKEQAALALMAVGWTPATAKAIGWRRLNGLLHQIRNQVLAGEAYRVFADMIARASDPGVPILHTQWELWKTVIAKYHLFEIADLQSWTSLVARLDTKSVRTPWDLHRIEFRELNEIDWGADNPDMLLWLWQAARQQATPGTVSPPVALYTPQPGFRKLILSLRKDHIDSTQISMGYLNLWAELGVRENSELLSNSAKCEALTATGAGRTSILRLLNLSAQRNTVRVFAGSLRIAASAMQSFKNFCDFTGRPPFPVCPDTILLWGGLFRPGKTFGLYLSHVMKAVALLRYPSGWFSPAIRAAARGLRSAADASFKFENYILASDLLVLIKEVKLATEFGQASFFPYLFLMRVPSATLCMRKADDDDRIKEYAPQKFKVLVGIRRVGCSDMLIAKFPWRKNLRMGCILRRHCLCDERTTMARVLCPVHQVWPWVEERTRNHGLLFPTYSAAKFNNELKQSMGRRGFRLSGKYSPHAFRRVATQEMQLAEASTDTIKTAG